MKLNKKLILLITFLIGLIFPFIPFLVVIEMFFLLIPFAILFVSTAIYLTASFIIKDLNSQKAVFIFSILPVLILSQLTSVFAINKIQRIRSKDVIAEIQKVKAETGNYPEKYHLSMGINYRLTKDSNNFEISYSSGFMVTEKYNSENKNWESYGWND